MTRLIWCPLSQVVSFNQPQKKAKTTTERTVEQEEYIWHHGLRWTTSSITQSEPPTKISEKKDSLWEFKAADMDKDLDILKTWYRFIRSRCTSLVHRKPRSHCGNEKTLSLYKKKPEETLRKSRSRDDSLVSWQKGTTGSFRTLPDWGHVSPK